MKEKKLKDINVDGIRSKLRQFEKELRKYSSKNRLTQKYQNKVEYMLMWMRFITIKKSTLNGWSMPDMGTIWGYEKRGLGDKI